MFRHEGKCEWSTGDYRTTANSNSTSSLVLLNSVFFPSNLFRSSITAFHNIPYPAEILTSASWWMRLANFVGRRDSLGEVSVSMVVRKVENFVIWVERICGVEVGR